MSCGIVFSLKGGCNKSGVLYSATPFRLVYVDCNNHRPVKLTVVIFHSFEAGITKFPALNDKND